MTVAQLLQLVIRVPFVVILLATACLALRSLRPAPLEIALLSGGA